MDNYFYQKCSRLGIIAKYGLLIKRYGVEELAAHCIAFHLIDIDIHPKICLPIKK